MKKYRFIVFRKGADSSNLKVYDIIDMQEDLTINEVENRLNFFENNIVVNLDIQKINKRQQNIIEELEKKEEILKGFYSETYPIKESIKNKMLSKKR